MPCRFRVLWKPAPAQALPSRAVARSRAAAVSWGKKRVTARKMLRVAFRMVERLPGVDPPL
jgi:hypothetical protein